jgi:hypothetical protein
LPYCGNHLFSVWLPLKSLIYGFITILWDITPCSLVYSCQLFGGTICLFLQGRFQFSLPLSVPLSPSAYSSIWRSRQQAPQKCAYPSTKLHGVTSQKTVIFIVTAMKTSSLTLVNKSVGSCALRTANHFHSIWDMGVPQAFGWVNGILDWAVLISEAGLWENWFPNILCYDNGENVTGHLPVGCDPEGLC